MDLKYKTCFSKIRVNDTKFQVEIKEVLWNRGNNIEQQIDKEAAEIIEKRNRNCNNTEKKPSQHENREL